MSTHDTTYRNLLSYVLHHGTRREDRTGTGTIQVFGTQTRYDLADGFPMLTTKRVFFRGIVEELLWFLSGDTNARTLQDRGVRIWDEWADPETGDLGPVYGAQWRNFGGVDQIATLIENLRTDPYSRRHIVTAWNPPRLPDMALPPCHLLYQFNVRPSGHLDCHLTQRSGDLFLGVPFNIASYALLTHLIAREVGLAPGEFVHSISDAHLYVNHLDQAAEQVARPTTRPAPTLHVAPGPALFDVRAEHITLEGYDPMPTISAPVAV